MELGRIGIWTSALGVGGADQLGEAAKLVEDLGYGTFWLGGSPPARALRKILDATTTLTAATGILNVWQHDPADAAREFLQLDPDRSLLGIGIGHPEATSDYRRPLKTMRDFFDGLDATGVPRDRMIAAALGPKMLQLAAERSLGTHPYFTPPEHTRFATQGPVPFVAPEVACVVDADVESARAKARRYAALYLNLTNYTSNLLRFGFTAEDIANGGSDRLIDAVVPHGSAESVAEQLELHFEAGADHVCVQPVGGDLRADWVALARVLS